MTRLTDNDIVDIAYSVISYDRDLIKKTGFSLGQIGAAAAGYDLSKNCLADCKVAIIPVTSGKGLIKGFSESVVAIVDHLGGQSFITGSTDVRGLTEAYSRDAHVVMLADDHCFAAINLVSRKIVDNAAATAQGYAVALDRMAGSLHNKDVLLIGAGQVGAAAAIALTELGAHLVIFDINKKKESNLARSMESRSSFPVRAGFSLNEALGRCSILFDASPGRHFVTGEQVDEKTLIAAPGIPLGLDPDAARKVSERLIHDPLQIGVATMLFQALVK